MIPEVGRPNLAAARYAKRRFSQAQRLGLVEGALQGDPASWWREFSQRPEAWNMEQQLAARRGVGQMQGMFDQQPQQVDLSGLMQNMLTQAPQAPQMADMRQDLVGQMMALQGQPGDPMDEMAQRYRKIGSRLGTIRQRGVVDKIGRKLRSVDAASNRAQKLAQLMSKRLRGV